MIEFSVKGTPRAQPRPRACRRGGRSGVYDPGTADGWKRAVVLAGQPHRPARPMEGPVIVALSFHLPRPKRLLKKSSPSGVIWCDGGGDVDNLAKAVLDCLTDAGWWHDDRQVANLCVLKYYAAIGAKPVTFISVGSPQ